MPGEGEKTVVLFDGVCNLCSATVQFILRRDPQGRFRFASQQSAVGQRLLAQHQIRAEEALADSVVVMEGGRVWLESDAVLHILYRLDGVWRLGAGLRVLPKPWRDKAYRWMARHRYRIFGKRQTCWTPRPEFAERFL